MVVHLIQLLLPIKPNAEQSLSLTREELVKRYQGVTAYVRSPARGAWVAPGGQEEHDDMVMVEVVVDAFDRGWWKQYQAELAARFGEERIHVRILPAEVL